MMGLGVVIASSSGGRNELLPDDVFGCLAEVRVEQSLDDPTRFALRFQEDIQDGDMLIGDEPALQPGRILTIAAVVDGSPVCLVRGPIERMRCQFAIGGPGSVVEVMGRDRRIELDRVCNRRPWTGRASEAVQSILDEAGFEVDVQQTEPVFSERQFTLNQHGTDLDFIMEVARRHNLHFWITYDCRVLGRVVDVTETANLKPSPPRPSGVSSPPPLDRVPIGDDEPSLQVNPPQQGQQTVSRFELDFDVERPTEVEATVVNDRSLNEDRTRVEDPQPEVQSGQTLSDIIEARRSTCLPLAGAIDFFHPRAQAAMTNAGWFVNATARTTTEMLGKVLFPHQLVQVQQLGKRHSGTYQVQSATHVINAAQHDMDVELRRNVVRRV